jgi:PASTA domain-containing protein
MCAFALCASTPAAADGHVVGQDPPAGAGVRPGSTVTLIVQHPEAERRGDDRRAKKACQPVAGGQDCAGAANGPEGPAGYPGWRVSRPMRVQVPCRRASATRLGRRARGHELHLARVVVFEQPEAAQLGQLGVALVGPDGDELVTGPEPDRAPGPVHVAA